MSLSMQEPLKKRSLYRSLCLAASPCRSLSFGASLHKNLSIEDVQIMAECKNDSTVLIASAICETKSRQPGTGSSLCKAQRTNYYPHMAYGDPSNLQECQMPFCHSTSPIRISKIA